MSVPTSHFSNPCSPLYFFFLLPPPFHWSELEMRGQQSTKPSNVWFFSKDLQKQSLAGWPLTAAHLFISPSAGTSFGRNALRFTPLSGGTSVYYVHAHSISCTLAHLKGEPWLVSLTNPAEIPTRRENWSLALRFVPPNLVDISLRRFNFLYVK